jgi:hypothetical protein
MPKITVAESLQVFLSILTDTVLDQIMDREHFPLASAFASGTRQSTSDLLILNGAGNLPSTDPKETIGLQEESW